MQRAKPAMILPHPQGMVILISISSVVLTAALREIDLDQPNTDDLISTNLLVFLRLVNGQSRPGLFGGSSNIASRPFCTCFSTCFIEHTPAGLSYRDACALAWLPQYRLFVQS
jgi:hypothetical protein